MKYWLKQYDTPLLKFAATSDSSEPEIEILWKNEEYENLISKIEKYCKSLTRIKESKIELARAKTKIIPKEAKSNKKK